MLVHIEEEQFELSINQWDDFTLGLFKLYADWRCDGNNKSNKSSKSNINNVNKINNIGNPLEEPFKTFVHNPNVAQPMGIGRKPLIEEWIRKTKKLEFTLEEYFMVYPNQRRGIEMLYTHISRLINKKSLIQIGENRFKIMV